MVSCTIAVYYMISLQGIDIPTLNILNAVFRLVGG